eukprot:CAMPEP_0197518176 /NCGR_PEP_ID=MMETSP1318-20131121/3305_1 /TAXON_ID=552666 /ORGANISM="Partenskyella glossopodia, Strain RCC365" /LENGTH=196 /DNA_ID=CAMNT_0043068293 /DNA_START=541 /DNA_END=1134 /DNA_ORIENTATION=+
MGVGTSPDFEFLGIIICVSSLVGQAIGIVMTAFVMGDKKVKLQPLDVLLYTTLPSLVVLIPWSYSIGEFDKLQTSIDASGVARILTLIAVGGLLAFTYTLFYVFFIKLTSSVYYSVTGGFRCTVAIIMSFYFFPQKITALSIAGIVVAMSAFIANSYFTLLEKLDTGLGNGSDKYEAMEVDEEAKQSLLSSQNDDK